MRKLMRKLGDYFALKTHLKPLKIAREKNAALRAFIYKARRAAKKVANDFDLI